MKKASLIILLSSGVLAIAFLPRRSASSQNATWRPAPKGSHALKVLVVTGGHDHDPDFYSVFDEERIKALVDPHPGAFQGDIRKRADVLVLYDMLKEMEPNRQKNLQDFVESGKGLVVLHHAIGDTSHGLGGVKKLLAAGIGSRRLAGSRHRATGTMKTSRCTLCCLTRSPGASARSVFGMKHTKASGFRRK